MYQKVITDYSIWFYTKQNSEHHCIGPSITSQKRLVLKWSTISFGLLTFLVPKKFGPHMKIIMRHFFRSQISWGSNVFGPKFLETQKVMGLNEIGDHFKTSHRRGSRNFLYYIIDGPQCIQSSDILRSQKIWKKSPNCLTSTYCSVKIGRFVQNFVAFSE